MGSPRALGRPQASPRPLFSPTPDTHPGFRPRHLDTQGREPSPPGGSCVGGATLREVQRAFFVSFPIPGRGEVAGANAVPGCQLTGLVPTPRHHPARGTGAQARSVEMLCFPKSVKGSRAGVSRPLSHTPGPGQHVDVSAELRCVKVGVDSLLCYSLLVLVDKADCIQCFLILHLVRSHWYFEISLCGSIYPM